jgi:hypothetical protein
MRNRLGWQTGLGRARSFDKAPGSATDQPVGFDDRAIDAHGWKVGLQIDQADQVAD